MSNVAPAVAQQGDQELSKFGILGQTLTKAWADDTFKQQLLANPKAVLQEAGLDIPDDLNIQVHEDTPTTLNLVLPAPPTTGDTPLTKFGLLGVMHRWSVLSSAFGPRQDKTDVSIQRPAHGNRDGSA